MTNFELERLFALGASPAIAAAMRAGGAYATTAAARLREAMTCQRQTASESYLSRWDTDRSGVVTVTDPAEAQGEARSPSRLEASTTSDREREAKERAAKEARCEQLLAALPVELVRASSAGDPCAICQDTMCPGEEVRRLPCAHVFHAECIARWMHVKLTCPLDSLPVDEGIDMLAAAHSCAADQRGAPAPASPPPLPASAAPPLPEEPLQVGAPEEAHAAACACGNRLAAGARFCGKCGAKTSEKASQGCQSGGRAQATGVLPPIGLQEMQAAAADAGVDVDQLADALARRRASGPTLVL